MSTSSNGPKGEPVFADPPTTLADLSANAAYAALVGNRIIGTASDRTNFTTVYGFAPYTGLEYVETDTYNTFLFNGTSWVGTQIQSAVTLFDQAGMVSAGGGWQGTLDLPLVPGRFTDAPIITLGVYTQSTNNQHAGIANVTATSFRLYLWRADRASTSVAWCASPSIQ